MIKKNGDNQISKNQTEISEILYAFLSTLDSIDRLYNNNLEKLRERDLMTQDYLHGLELTDFNYAERAKIATKLRNVRRKRRKAKDYIEICEPLEEFIHNSNNQKFISKLKEVLGQVRKLEKSHQNRIYINKIIDKEDWCSDRTCSDGLCHSLSSVQSFL